jgi:hypothetical protein
MRKILAVICTLLALLAIKESAYLLTTSDAEILAKKTQLSIAAISITLPLIILSLWLWRPRDKKTVKTKICAVKTHLAPSMIQVYQTNGTYS